MLYIKNDFNVRTIALLEAIRLFDSGINLCLAIKINPSSLSKWISNPLIKMPYEVALRIEEMTGISIERLMPHKKETNDYLNNRISGKLILREISTKSIITNHSLSLPFLQPNQLLILGTDRVLISGVELLNDYSGTKIKALFLDLLSLINGSTHITAILSHLLISERIAIYLRVEQLMSNQGQTAINLITQIIGCKEDAYIAAQQVYFSHNQELINAVNNKTISITEAAKLITAQQSSKILITNK